jgi:hypothetical protein
LRVQEVDTQSTTSGPQARKDRGKLQMPYTLPMRILQEVELSNYVTVKKCSFMEVILERFSTDSDKKENEK